MIKSTLPTGAYIPLVYVPRAGGLIPVPLHQWCNVCGWRKGGVDSWDGLRCKCKIMGSPMVIDAEGV